MRWCFRYVKLLFLWKVPHKNVVVGPKVPHKSVAVDQKVPHKSVAVGQKVPHKNVIYFAISFFFSIFAAK